jgi:hypothetical protein
MNDILYNTFDETHIPLSSTATMWMDRINTSTTTTTNPTRKNLLNSQSVVQIILRRAPAPDLEPDHMTQWTSKRLVPLNQHLVPTPSTNSKHLFGNFLSPTQAARSREWKKTHVKTYLRPSVAVKKRRKQNPPSSSFNTRNTRNTRNTKTKRTMKTQGQTSNRVQQLEHEIQALKKKLHRQSISANHHPEPIAQYRKHMHLSSKSNFNTCHSQHDTTQQQPPPPPPPNSTTFPPMHQRHINRQQHAQSTSALEPITSGTCYKSRRAILQTLQDNEKLSKLTTRKIRMETKLQETLHAWTHMHKAIGDAVKVLHESESTEKESKRVYPRLLQSMERNRKQLQRQLEKMTRLVDTAHQEEQDFIELIASKMRGDGGGYKNDGGARKHKRMKAKTTRTLL